MEIKKEKKKNSDACCRNGNELVGSMLSLNMVTKALPLTVE